jgi:hypothetical protein
MTLTELKNLWGQFLGGIPCDQQWAFWATIHSPEVIRNGVLQTVKKNLSVGGIMSDDYKLRFASKVMITSESRNEEHAENRERLAAEMEGR